MNKYYLILSYYFFIIFFRQFLNTIILYSLFKLFLSIDISWKFILNCFLIKFIHVYIYIWRKIYGLKVINGSSSQFLNRFELCIKLNGFIEVLWSSLFLLHFYIIFWSQDRWYLYISINTNHSKPVYSWLKFNLPDQR